MPKLDDVIAGSPVPSSNNILLSAFALVASVPFRIKLSPASVAEPSVAFSNNLSKETNPTVVP